MGADYLIAGETPSTANLREHWAKKARRMKDQRVSAHYRTIQAAQYEGVALREYGGTVTLWRLAPRKLDSDNLAGALKAIRDGIAEALGVDDGDPRITWRYEQERCKKGQQAVRVVVEACRPVRMASVSAPVDGNGSLVEET